MILPYQENVVFALQLATAVYHSRIVGVDTEVVLQTVVAKSGARSLLTLGRTNCGGTAGVEQDVSQINLPRSCSFFLRSFVSLFFQFVCCFALYFSACVSCCIRPRFNRFMFVCPSGRKTHTTSSVTHSLSSQLTSILASLISVHMALSAWRLIVISWILTFIYILHLYKF